MTCDRLLLAESGPSNSTKSHRPYVRFREKQTFNMKQNRLVPRRSGHQMGTWGDFGQDSGWRVVPNSLICNGGQGQNRTADTRIFSPLLYQLSYLAKTGARLQESGNSRDMPRCRTCRSPVTGHRTRSQLGGGYLIARIRHSQAAGAISEVQCERVLLTGCGAPRYPDCHARFLTAIWPPSQTQNRATPFIRRS